MRAVVDLAGYGLTVLAAIAVAVGFAAAYMDARDRARHARIDGLPPVAEPRHSGVHIHRP